MKSIKLKLFITVVLSMHLCVDSAMAQKPGIAANGDNCLVELRKIIDKEKKHSNQLLADGKVWHMNFLFMAMAKAPAEQEYHAVNTKGEVLASKKYKYVKEDEYEIYMDDKDVFTINSKDKSIMRTASNPQALEPQQSNPFFDLYSDTLLNHFSFNSCIDVYDSSLKMNLVCYTILPINKDRVMYSKIKIYVDKKVNAIKKIQTWYNSNIVRDMQMSTVVVNSSGEKKNTAITLPVKDIFLASNGQLKLPYHKYKYKDLKK